MNGSSQWEGSILPANTSQPVTGIMRQYDESQEWSSAGFWFKWVLATTFGLAVSGAVGGAAASLFGSYEDPRTEITEYLASVFVIVMQWIVLRPRLRRAYLWIVAGIAGIAAGGALFQALDFIVGRLGGWTSSTEGAVQLFLEGLTLAVVQWLLLRRYAQRAVRWILANLLWIILFTPLFLFAGSDTADAPLLDVVESAILSAIVLTIFGLISGAITGAEMVWLLRHPRKATGDAEAPATLRPAG